VQHQVLDANPAANLQVYAVWFNMLYGDSRDGWDGNGLTDQRVLHFWDEQKLVGNWFSTNVTHARGTTWDFYALYGPDAGGLAAPASMGGAIIARRDQLQSAIAPLPTTSVGPGAS
jgi:hypothetical protein